MTQVERNMLVEQFNYTYPNRGKLQIMLPTPGSPAHDLKPVTAFTDDEKAAYMADVLYLNNIASIRRAGRKGECEMPDIWDESFEVPSSITRAYLASLA